MDNIFEQLFQYEFQNSEITSIEVDSIKLEIKLNFEKGIYLFDENGQKIDLSKPMQIVLKINKYYSKFFEEVLDIWEYEKKIKYLEYKKLKKNLQKESFRISMFYYSIPGNCILFDGEILRKNIRLAIDDIKEIIIQDL